MKNFKFLSSLAVAGMLTTGIMTTTLAATDVPTEPVGIFKELSGVKNIVPFVLANRDDKVCISDLTASGKFNNITMVKGSTVINQETVLGTGDTFKANGDKEYTVVVYGDVDGNGAINILDALAIQDSVANGPSTLTGAQAEAANVLRKDGSGINILDALHIEQYRAPETDEIIDETPVPEEETSDYKVTVNDNGYVNSENVAKSKATVELTPLEENETVKIVITKKDGTKLEKEVTIPANMNKCEVSLPNLTSLEDGEYSAEMLDKEGNVLATFTFEKNVTSIPEAIQVHTHRENGQEATMSFVAKDGSDITHMYYVIVKQGEAALNNANELLSSDKLKEMDITDSKLENEMVAVKGDLDDNKTATIYYIVENHYGNKGTMANKVIALDTYGTNATNAIDTIEVPDLTKTDIATGKFSFVPEEGNAFTRNDVFVVTVYKDGTPIKEIELKSSDFTINGTKAEVVANKLLDGTEGTYKISAYVKGSTDGKTEDSEAKESSEITISALEAVTNVQYVVDDDGNKKITWDSNYNKDEIAGYKVTLKRHKADGTYEVNTKDVEPVADAEKKEAPITISDNVIYRAEVEVLPLEDQSANTKSAMTPSEDFFSLAANTLSVDTTKTTSDSITLNVKPLTGAIAQEGVEYIVHTWERTDNSGEEDGAMWKEIGSKTVTLDKNNQTVIDGLESGKTYRFKLEVKVKDATAESAAAPKNGETTKLVVPEIKNLVVSAEPGANKIAFVDGKLYINSEEGIATSDYSKYYTEADLQMVESLVNPANKALVNGDIITVEDEKVTVTLQGQASSSTAAVRDFKGYAKDMTLELIGDKSIKTVKATSAKKVILSSKDGVGRFNIDNLKADEVVLTNGTDATIKAAAEASAQQLTVEKNSTVTINGVEVTAGTSDLKLKATGTIKFVIDATNAKNDISFKNTTSTALTLIFNGNSDLSSKQSGTITVESGADVSISTNGKMNLESDLNITVTDGDVNVSNELLVGAKKVTVSVTEEGSAKVTGVSNVALPEAISANGLKGFELKEMTVAQIKTYFAKSENTAVTTAIVTLTDEQAAEVKAYLDSFGVNGCGAKLTTKSNGVVEIEFTKTVTNAEVRGIK